MYARYGGGLLTCVCMLLSHFSTFYYCYYKMCNVNCHLHCVLLLFCVQENNNPINASQESWHDIAQPPEAELRSIGVRSENSESESRDESADVQLLNARLDVSVGLCQPCS